MGSASAEGTGGSARSTSIASPAPANWATTKAGTLDGAMPANVSLSMRPSAAAGLANRVGVESGREEELLRIELRRIPAQQA